MDIETFRAYCLAKKGVTEEFPFGETTLVFKVVGKMFALTGLDEPTGFKVSLKCDPERALELRDQYPESIVAGYHLNKKHWNTVQFDGDILDVLLRDMVDHSYELVVKGLKKAERAALLDT